MKRFFFMMMMVMIITSIKLPHDHPCADPRTIDRMEVEWKKLSSYKEFMVFQQHYCFSLFMDSHLTRQRSFQECAGA